MNIIKYFITILKSKNTVNIWLFTDAYHIKHIIFYGKSKKFFYIAYEYAKCPIFFA